MQYIDNIAALIFAGGMGTRLCSVVSDRPKVLAPVNGKPFLSYPLGQLVDIKVISCLHGKFYLVVINYDEQSKDFGKWESFVLSDRNKHQVLVPSKHGNGYLRLSLDKQYRGILSLNAVGKVYNPFMHLRNKLHKGVSQ